MSNTDIVKNAIAESTKELMRHKTIDKISVIEICEQSGLERRNFYRYFHDKFEVVDWIYYHDHLIQSKHYEGWGIWDYFPGILQGLASDPKYYYNAFHYRGQNSFREYAIQHLYPILHRDFKDKFPSEINEKFFIEHICNLSFDIFEDWLAKPNRMPPEELYQFFRNTFRIASETFLEMLDRPVMAESSSEEFNVKEPSRK